MKKRILIAIIIVFIVVTGAGFSYYYPMILMHPVVSGKIPGSEITILNAVSAVYLINTGGGYIMIDAGLSEKKLKEALEEVRVDPNEIKWIFLTHSDGDHVGGLNLFPNIKVYMSKNEIPLINGTASRTLFGGNKLPYGTDMGRIIPLFDGQELFLHGVSLKCIEAPGHTPGSMFYLIDGKYLFTGDAVKIVDGKKSVHPYTMDKEQSVKTIEELESGIYNNALILTSHYGVCNN